MLRFLILAAGLSLVAAAKFPSYISKCGRDDPEFNKCALASARAAKEHLVRGDRAFRLQPMDPLLVSQLRVEQGGTVGLNITLNDIRITGLAGLEFTDNFNLDFIKQSLSFEVLVPRLELNSGYEMKGRILILPIIGKGRANITLSGLLLQLSTQYKLVKRDNGKQYVSLDEPNVIIKPKKGYIDLGNLFNGDPLLGPQTNLFINENWKEVIDDVGPGIAQGIGAAILKNLQGIVDKVPYDELIPATLSG